MKTQSKSDTIPSRDSIAIVHCGMVKDHSLLLENCRTIRRNRPLEVVERPRQEPGRKVRRLKMGLEKYSANKRFLSLSIIHS